MRESSRPARTASILPSALSWERDYTGASEYGAKRKLERLPEIARLLVEGSRDAEFQGADRRVPGEAESPGRAQLRETDPVGRRVDLPRVDEGAEAHRPILQIPRNGKKQLRAQVDLAIAPEEGAVDVARTQRCGAEAAHAADAARVIVLEERQRLAPVAVRGVELPGSHQRHVASRGIEVLMGIARPPELQVSRRGRDLQVCALQVAPRRPDHAVARVAYPSPRADQGRVPAAELVFEREVALRPQLVEEQPDVLDPEPEEQGVVLSERNAEPHRGAGGARPVVPDPEGHGVHVAPVDVEAAADAVDRPIGLREREGGDLVDRSRCDLESDRVAGSEEIGLLHRRLENQPVDAGESDADQERPGGFLLHPHVDVDLVGGAGDGRCFDLHLAEVARPVDALLRDLQLLAVEEAALELAHLAPDDLVARARITCDVDPPDVDAATRVDQEGKL